MWIALVIDTDFGLLFLVCIDVFEWQGRTTKWWSFRLVKFTNNKYQAVISDSVRWIRVPFSLSRFRVFFFQLTKQPMQWSDLILLSKHDRQWPMPRPSAALTTLLKYYWWEEYYGNYRNELKDKTIQYNTCKRHDTNLTMLCNELSYNTLRCDTIPYDPRRCTLYHITSIAQTLIQSGAKGTSVTKSLSFCCETYRELCPIFSKPHCFNWHKQPRPN